MAGGQAGGAGEGAGTGREGGPQDAHRGVLHARQQPQAGELFGFGWRGWFSVRLGSVRFDSVRFGCSSRSLSCPPTPSYRVPLLRGAIVNRTYGAHKKLYFCLYLLTVFGPIYYGPP